MRKIFEGIFLFNLQDKLYYLVLDISEQVASSIYHLLLHPKGKSLPFSLVLDTDAIPIAV